MTFSGGGGSGAAGTATLRTTQNRGSDDHEPGERLHGCPFRDVFGLGAGQLGITATGTAVLQSGVAEVTITNPGSGYTAVPTVTFGAAPGAGTTAAGTAVLRYGVASVTITNGGSGYTSAPTVTFGAAPSGGTTAAGTAVLRYGVASVTVTDGGAATPPPRP